MWCVASQPKKQTIAMATKATILTAAALAATSNPSTLAFTLPRPTANHAAPFRPAAKFTTALYSETSSTVPEPSTMSASEMITALSSKPITALTPEGYGFSSPAERILKLAKRDNGYYRAKGSDSVVDVMEGIEREGKFDVALVFDENDDGKERLLGIFTDADYIRVSFDRLKPIFVRYFRFSNNSVTWEKSSDSIIGCDVHFCFR